MAMSPEGLRESQAAFRAPQRAPETLAPVIPLRSRKAPEAFGLVIRMPSEPAPLPPVFEINSLLHSFEDLSPAGQKKAKIKKTIIEASGGLVTGFQEVHTQGASTELRIFVANDENGDTRSDLLGGREHEIRDENGNVIGKETVISEHF